MPQQDLQQALMDAMFAVASKGDNSLQFDRTIECVIEEIKNISTGEYLVKYLDAIFSAYDLTLAGNYKVGKTVYVQIPRNDMSQKKIILGIKSTSEEEIAYVKLLSELVSKKGLPIENIYDINIDESGICGYAHSKSLFLNDGQQGIQDEVLQSYAKPQTAIMVSAEFKTKWWEPNITSGNYGLRIKFNTKDDNEYVCDLDLSSATGNPLKYSIYTPIEKLFTIDGKNIKSLKSIELFSSDFKILDNIDRTIKNDKLIEYETSADYEIYVQNLSISFVEEQNVEGYILDISVPNGYYWDKRKDNKLLLKAVLKYNGQTEVIKSENVKYYWFIKNPLINSTVDEYSELGGSGWELIQGANSQTYEITEWITGTDLKIYKVIAIYENNKTSDEITIYETIAETKRYSLELIRESNTDGTLRVVGDNLSGLQFGWEIKDSLGNIITVNSTNSSVPVSISNIDGSHTYYCYVYSANKNLLSILTYVVTNEEIELDYFADFIVSNNGVFTYNALGDLYGNQFGEEPILTHTIELNTDIQYEKIKWIFPNNSLITRTSIEEDSTQSFTINKRYDAAKAGNNIIKVTLSEIPNGPDKIELEYALQFIKEGDPGTNGTSLTLIVKPYEQNSYSSLSTKSIWRIQYNLYFNGEDITHKGWFDFDSITIPNGYRKNNPLWDETNKQLLVSFNNTSNIFTINKLAGFNITKENYNSIIQIKLKPSTTGKEKGFSYPIMALYGIPLSIENHEETPQVLKYVVYDSNGEYPKYANIQSFLADGFTAEWVSADAQGELIESIVDNIADTFIYDMRGAIIFSKDEDFFIQPVVFQMNAYSQKILNAWDGSSIQIDENNNHILATQVGAGIKESNNTFTGVLMGALTVDGNYDYGLYGFKSGIATFGFKEDGTAFIGASGSGRIEFDGEKGIIQSGNYDTNVSGMKINLADGLIDAYNFRLKSSALEIKSDKSQFDFNIKEDSNGSFSIKGATQTLLNISNNNYYLQSDNYIKDTSGMRINLQDGSIDAKNFKITGSTGNATFNGTITAEDGEIGGWLIESNYLKSASGDTKLYADGKLYVDYIKATDGEFKGDIYADYIETENGKIGGWEISANKLQGTYTELRSSGRIYTDYLIISDYGKIGYLEGVGDGETTTSDTLGVSSYSNVSIVLDSSDNIRFSADGTGIYFDANKIEAVGSPTIVGFYATLA